jgi:hypothetical protein
MEHPEREKTAQNPDGFKRATLLEILGAAIASLTLTLLGSYVAAEFGATEYGYGFFLLPPFAMGVLGSLFIEARRPRCWADHAFCAMAAIGITSFGFLVFLKEGAVCILMAWPLFVPLSLLGARLTQVAMNRRWRRKGMMVALPILVPVWLAIEGQMAFEPSHRSVTTSIEISATPAEIWPHLNNLKVSPPQGGLLRLGFAHPLRVMTTQARAGGRRECLLSTGAMPERITNYKPGRRLTFEILETPASMIETNPFGQVKPSHLKGYYECEVGEFRLTQLPNGRTRLEGQSWFKHRFAPSWYWSLWTDRIVSEVHQLVMGDVKQLAERDSIRPGRT